MPHSNKFCVIPKLFPYGEFLPYMKLTRGKLLETLRRKNQGWTTYQARKIAGISIRRVNQVWEQFLVSGEIPEIGIKNGRPKRPIEDWEIKTVKEAFEKYSVSATALMKLIERDYGIHINHNRIHVILVMLDMAKIKSKKDIRKKDWIRYERSHEAWKDKAVHKRSWLAVHKNQASSKQRQSGKVL